MTWTYNLTELATTPLFQARALIGDTLTTDQQLQDEEILFFLSRRNSVYGGCALACFSLAAKYSRSADQSAGGNSLKLSNLSAQYAARAREFEVKAALGASPYAGALSLIDKENNQQNPDIPPPSFNIGMSDNYLPVSPQGNENLTNTAEYGVSST